MDRLQRNLQVDNSILRVILEVLTSGMVYTTSEIYINIKVEGKGVSLSEKVTIPMKSNSGNLMCYKYI